MVSRPLEQGQGIRNFADFPRVAPGRSPRKLLLFRCRGSHIPQRPMVVGEVAGIENLGTGVMLAIEGILQPTLANSFFGPSVFFLVRKA